MVIGCIEDVTFAVSSESVMTPSGIGYKYSASVATHERAAGSTLIEYTGEENPTYSLKIVLNEYAGANVGHAIHLLREYLRNGTTVRMVFGKEPCGRYRWLIESMEVTEKSWAGDGSCTLAEVSLTLREYLRK